MAEHLQTFDLAHTGTSRILSLGLPAIFLITGVGLCIANFSGVKGFAPGSAVILIIFIGISGWLLFKELSIPKQLFIEEGEVVRLKSLISESFISIADIITIEPSGGSLGYFKITHSHGSVRFLNQFNNFHVFVSRLRAINPHIITKGC